MYGYQMSEYDYEVYQSKIADFVPEKIIDAHTHIFTKDCKKKVKVKHEGLVTWTSIVYDELSIEDFHETYKTMLPKTETTPIVFGTPSGDLKKTNEYSQDVGKRYGHKTLYCTSYDMSAEEIEWALTEGGFSGIKPYLNNSPSYIPADEIRIFDFVPHEHLKVLDKYKANMVLHIARPQRLRDKVNVAQLMEIEEKYQNLKMTVAHIGRAYAPDDLGDAFETLKHSKNMVFDFCASTFSPAMRACLEVVGPKRLLFGSDMPITKMRMYRIVENGTYINVVPRGMYGDVSNDPHMRETDEPNLTNFLYEEIMAFRKAAEEVGLSKEDVKDVFYNNAAKLYGIE